MNAEESRGIWLNDYDARYGGEDVDVKTALASAKGFLSECTTVWGGNMTLLDAGCGLGIWSLALAEWHDVTGVDNCETAIRRAREIAGTYLHRATLQFVCDDARNVPGPFDIVFCRCPEFFSGYPVEDPVFREYLASMVDKARKKLVYIAHTQPPYERYVSTNPKQKRTSYMNSPEKVHKALSEFGETRTAIYHGTKHVSEIRLSGEW